MDRGVTEIRDFVDAAQFFEDLCPNIGGLDLAAAGFQIVHDFIDELLERQQTGGALLESFGNAAGEFSTIERLVSAIALHHPQVRALDLLVSGEAISAFEALAAPANAGAIARLTGIDDLVITRAALGATHSVKGLNRKPHVVASTIFNTWNCCSAEAATALRGELFLRFLSAHSKRTLPFCHLCW